MDERATFDLEGYVERIRSGPCFICGLVAGNRDYRHHFVYEDADSIAFLNRYTPLRGYVLVCPKAHVEQVTGDVSLEAYLALQGVVYRVSEAVRRAMGAARVYVLSLGSNEGNSHVHWHVAPLPHGVPLEAQQFDALDARRGVLALSDEELGEIAGRIRAALTHT